MRLTSFTDFGLRALMRLAGSTDRVFTTVQMAEEFGISRNHLTKVIRQLAASGIIATQRGSGGGLRLARPPQEISLGEIVRLLESRSAMAECFRPAGGACTLRAGCRLRSRLSAAREAFLRELDRTTLAECAWRPDYKTYLPECETSRACDVPRRSQQRCSA